MDIVPGQSRSLVLKSQSVRKLSLYDKANMTNLVIQYLQMSQDHSCLSLSLSCRLFTTAIDDLQTQVEWNLSW